MNNLDFGTAIESITQVFAGKNGPVLGGIIGIVSLVCFHSIANSNCRIAGGTDRVSISIDPAEKEKMDIIEATVFEERQIQ